MNGVLITVWLCAAIGVAIFAAMIASIGITCDWTYAQKLTMPLKGHVARTKQ